MSSSGGSSGGTGPLLIGNQSSTVPWGSPGLYDLAQSTPANGAWIAFDMQGGATRLVVGDGADNAFEALLFAQRTASQVQVFSDGSESGYATLEANPLHGQVNVRAMVGQTVPTMLVRDENGVDVMGVTPLGAFDMVEQADPAAPAANTGRLYTRDNGAGKTQLCVVFPTGAVQVLATQP